MFSYADADRRRPSIEVRSLMSEARGIRVPLRLCPAGSGSGRCSQFVSGAEFNAGCLTKIRTFAVPAGAAGAVLSAAAHLSGRASLRAALPAGAVRGLPLLRRLPPAPALRPSPPGGCHDSGLAAEPSWVPSWFQFCVPLHRCAFTEMPPLLRRRWGMPAHARVPSASVASAAC